MMGCVVLKNKAYLHTEKLLWLLVIWLCSKITVNCSEPVVSCKIVLTFFLSKSKIYHLKNIFRCHFGTKFVTSVIHDCLYTALG